MSILTWNRPFLRRTAYDPVNTIYRDEEMVLYAWRMDITTQIVFYARVHPHDLEQSRLYITAPDMNAPAYKYATPKPEAAEEIEIRRWYASSLSFDYLWFAIEVPFTLAPPYAVALAATERVGRAASLFDRSVALAVFAHVQRLQRTEALGPERDALRAIFPSEEEVRAFLHDPLNSPWSQDGRMRTLTEYKDKTLKAGWGSPYMLLHALEELQKYGPPPWILGR